MDYDYRYVELEVRDRVATITLNRPERRNVLSPAMLEELLRIFSDVAASDVLGVILAANGSVFSAGHDFTDMLDQELESVRSLFALCSEVMQSMKALPQPLLHACTPWRRERVVNSSRAPTWPSLRAPRRFAPQGDEVAFSARRRWSQWVAP